MVSDLFRPRSSNPIKIEKKIIDSIRFEVGKSRFARHYRQVHMYGCTAHVCDTSCGAIVGKLVQRGGIKLTDGYIYGR